MVPKRDSNPELRECEDLEATFQGYCYVNLPRLLTYVGRRKPFRYLDLKTLVSDPGIRLPQIEAEWRKSKTTP